MARIVPPIHLACLSDDMRPNMRLIHIKDGIAAATNGHILVKINLLEASEIAPEKVELMNGKHIHMEVWADMCKADLIEITDEQISCCIKGVWKSYEFSNPNGEFFSYNSVVEGVRLAGTEAKELVAYNAKLIQILASIFKSQTLYFSFSPDYKGTVVFPGIDTGMMAIIMPMQCTEINRYIF